MKGDLLFYSGGSLVDRFVQGATNGPWSHVAIDCGDGTVIEAISTGIRRRQILVGQDIGRILATGGACDPRDVDGAIEWLRGRVGQRYGWDDILNSIVFAVFGSRAPTLTWSQCWDCSDLAARFLVRSGFPMSDQMMSFSVVNPNNLYEWVVAVLSTPVSTDITSRVAAVDNHGGTGKE